MEDLQGNRGADGAGALRSAACAKQLAVHSGPEAIRHSFDVHPTKRDLAATYLSAFRALVQEAGVESVMGAYNRLYGEPCCGSKKLLTDLLRENGDLRAMSPATAGRCRIFMNPIT